jgi:hypothetical protein
VAPEPATEVQDEIARPDAEPVVIDGQHGSVTWVAAESAVGAPGSGRPSSMAW